jgi:hypothetical protein
MDVLLFLPEQTAAGAAVMAGKVIVMESVIVSGDVGKPGVRAVKEDTPSGEKDREEARSIHRAGHLHRGGPPM